MSSDPKDETKRLLAAEEASMKGFMRHVIDLYERVLKLALEHRMWLAVSAAVLIVISYVSYKALGSDLLPATFADIVRLDGDGGAERRIGCADSSRQHPDVYRKGQRLHVRC